MYKCNYCDEKFRQNVNVVNGMPVKESSGIYSMFLENHRNLNQNLAGLTSLFSEKITTSTATTIMTTNS